MTMTTKGGHGRGRLTLVHYRQTEDYDASMARYRVPRSRDIKKRILSGEVSKNARESKAQGNQQEDDAQLAHDEEDEEDEDSKH
jgi:hypothetical protein